MPTVDSDGPDPCMESARVTGCDGQPQDAPLDQLDQWVDPDRLDRWNRLYRERRPGVPFLTNAPDENLAQWFEQRAPRHGRAVDLGCGNGRNALHLARRGFDVVGVDLSPAAIAWAHECAAAAGLAARWWCRSVFDLEGCDGIAAGSFDLVYDSGCFHHLPPHRRAGYVQLVRELLKPGGWFGLVCFRPEGGSGLTDRQVHEQRTLGGGLGYTEAQLRAIWSQGLHVHEVRRMRAQPVGGPLFGRDFLWVLWAGRG